MNGVDAKFRVNEIERIRDVVLRAGAMLDGKDRQVDTCYRIPRGHFKVRVTELDLDHLLFQPNRPGTGIRETASAAIPIGDAQALVRILDAALPRLAVVRKAREIYVDQDVRIHLDRVEGLGDFVEIEAFPGPGASAELGRGRVREWMEKTGLADRDLVPASYPDLVAGSG